MKLPYNYPSQRDNDFYLMDEINKTISSTIDLERINACKLNLEVIFLSNITNNQGNRLLNGIPSSDKEYLKNSNLQWSNQPSQNKKSWHLWSSTISKIYCKNYKSAALRHEKNLGHWTVIHFKHSQFHPFLYSPSLNIYHRKNKTITQWFSSPILSQTITTIPDSHTIYSNIPEYCFLIEELNLNQVAEVQTSNP